MITAVYVVTLLIAILMGLLLNVVLLHLGARWAKIEGTTWRRSLGAVLAVCVLSIFLNGILLFLGNKSGSLGLLADVAQSILAVIAVWIVIAGVLRTTFWRAAQAWLPTLLSCVVIVPLILLIVRPFILEAFTMPTNSMAPTLLGLHWQGICPTCGGPMYCSAPQSEYDLSSDGGKLMICGRCFRTATIRPSSREVHGGDRFLVCKFTAPRRWDIIVFRLPGDPKTFFAKRLIGLPGEEVTIKDGSVWIDGNKQTPPDSLNGITYVTEFERGTPALWGTEASPAKLGPDEYFVLGDFSPASQDSRLWETGAPDHPPYAVPASYISGVVTHIYWPPSRYRTLR